MSEYNKLGIEGGQMGSDKICELYYCSLDATRGLKCNCGEAKGKKDSIAS